MTAIRTVRAAVPFQIEEGVPQWSDLGHVQYGVVAPKILCAEDERRLPIRAGRGGAGVSQPDLRCPSLPSLSLLFVSQYLLLHPPNLSRLRCEMNTTMRSAFTAGGSFEKRDGRGIAL